MRYSALTQRIAGEGAAAWQIHDRALELRAEGVDILLLSVGDPDFDTPLPIVHGAIDSLLAGDTHYSDVRGRLALRKLIAARHQRRSGQVVDAEHVIVLPGAQCAVYSVAQCLLDPGDEVILAEPMYVTYEGVFGACGATVVPVPVRPENGFRVDPDDVAARITPKTRAMLLNSPNNPSGASLSLLIWAAMRYTDLGKALKALMSGYAYFPSVAMQSVRSSDVKRDEAARIASLSDRELMVLQQLAKGLSNKQIARELGIPRKKLRIVKKAITLYNATPHADPEEGGLTLGDIVADERLRGPEDELINTDHQRTGIQTFTHPRFEVAGLL